MRIASKPPETDADVLEILTPENQHDPLEKAICDALHGIYRCRREGHGMSVQDAFVYALRCHVDPEHQSLDKL